MREGADGEPVTIPRQATGGDDRSSYFSDEEQRELDQWRRIVAALPPMTPDEIESAASALNRLAAIGLEFD